jgi:hypothetical protein
MPSRTKVELQEENEELLAREDEILDVLDDPDLGNEEKLEEIERLLDAKDEEDEN